MRTVYTGGTFDCLHVGHVHFLWQCRMIAGPEGRVVVALNTDDFISRFKNRKPVFNYDERLSHLQMLRPALVDEVVPNSNGEDSKPTILRVKPNFIVIADDWAKKDYYKQMNFTQEWIDENNMVLMYVPYAKNISTTEIRNRLVNSTDTPLQ
jgi:cytidyltransferase-like protein